MISNNPDFFRVLSILRKQREERKVESHTEKISATMTKKYPEFFKVYLSHLSSSRLRIPPNFFAHISGTIPRKIILKDWSGKSWHVELEEAENGLFFHDGWLQFVSDNLLQDGDFLVFRCIHDSLFVVRMFSKDECEKENVLANAKSMTDVKNEADPKKVENESKPIRACKQKGSETSHDKQATAEVKIQASMHGAEEDAEVECIIKKSPYPKALGTKRRTTGDLKATNKIVLKRPSFRIFVSQYYLKGNLSIPVNIVRQYFPGAKAKRIIVLQVANRSWPVKFMSYSSSVGRFTGGWITFVKDNNIREGDVCIFELMKKNSVVLKVSIVRCIN